MRGFGWIKKEENKKSNKRSAAEAFREEEQVQEEEEEATDTRTKGSRDQIQALEDPQTRYKRLKEEGGCLAQDGKYWQALSLWEQIPVEVRDSETAEMRSQALIQLHEWDQAVEEGREAVEKSKGIWTEARQTLGRAFIGCGRIKEARREFAIALHLKPQDQELRREDLLWANRLYRHQLAEEEIANANDGGTKQ